MENCSDCLAPTRTPSPTARRIRVASTSAWFSWLCAAAARSVTALIPNPIRKFGRTSFSRGIVVLLRLTKKLSFDFLRVRDEFNYAASCSVSRWAGTLRRSQTMPNQDKTFSV